LKRVFVLQSPKQQDFVNPAVEVSSKKVAAWLRDLPILNLSLTLHSLIDAVTSLNTQQVLEANRTQLLDLYYETARMIYPSIEIENLSRLPISHRQREQAKEDISLLLQALADGYKIVVKTAYFENRSLAKSPLLLSSVYNLMELLSLIILNAYRTYRIVPRATFLEIHQLYLLTVQEQIVDTNITIDKNKDAITTVNTLYKRIMSLTTIDPYHLSDGAIYKLYNLIREYACLCELTTAQNRRGSHKQYFIDLNNDNSPADMDKTIINDFHADTRILDLQPMIDNITHYLINREKKKDKSTEIDDMDLLKLFVPDPDVIKDRKSERINSDDSAMLMFGIDAVHYFTTIGVLQLKRKLFENDDTPLPIQAEDVKEEEYRLEPWRVGNKSANGYLLEGRQHFANELRVGELAGIIIKKPSDKNIKIELATIRWMRQGSESKIEIGVETIPGNALPVTCIIDEEPAHEFKGMYLPGNFDSNTNASLLMPKKLYRRERRMKILTGQKSLDVKAKYLTEDTACFDRFEFISE
jgi:hypothetical protein